MAQEPEAVEANTRRIPVERDSTFHRSVADTGLVIDLGRDMEIAFIQIGPAVATRLLVAEDDDEQEGYEMRVVATEVSRVRLSRPSALTMAMTVVENLAKDGRIKRDSFIAQIGEMFDRNEDDAGE